MNIRGIPVPVLAAWLAAAPVLWSAEWTGGPGFRSQTLPTMTGSRAGFTLLPENQTGLRHTNLLSEDRSLTNQIYQNGSGVALGDVDGDGLCDIYLGGLDGPNALYRNLGNWRFEDITARAGVACSGLDTTGVLFADLDGDGDLDLFVNALGRGTSIYINDGRGHFIEATKTAGTGTKSGATSLALADVDDDGDLDLYVTNYRTTTLRDEPFTRFTINVVNGKPELAAVNGRSVDTPELRGRFTVDARGTIAEHGEPDIFFRNEGGGKFTPVSWTGGNFLDETGRPVAMPYEFGLSVMLRDFNGDGRPDLYVCNDFDGSDRFWLNQGRGVFQLAPPLALRQTSLFSMGVDVADLDRDGHDDIFVVDMLSREHARRMVQLGDRRGVPSQPGVFTNRPQYLRNTLFCNRGDGTYAEVAAFAGLEASEWSWTPVFLDVDLDGYEDLLISNGHERDGQNVDTARQVETLKKERRLSAVEQLRLRKIYPRLDNAALAFRNLGGLRFEDASAAWSFNAAGVKQGLALADLDNDGDLDAVLNCLNGPALLYRNDATAPRVQVRLKGLAPNTRGVGAKIRVLGGPVPQSQEIICGGRYLSGDDFVRIFAAGSATNRLTIEVTWRSGVVSVVTNVLANSVIEVDERVTVQSSKFKVQSSKFPPLFSDVSVLLNHAHHEEDFNDFERQPLLVRKHSQPGPGVAWFDLDGDGRDDLLVGSGRGGTMAAFRNTGPGGFEPLKRAPFNALVTRDQTAVLGVLRIGARTLLAGSSHYEDGETNGGGVRVHDLATGKVSDPFPGRDSATGPLALADFNGDGELDLFVGGRVVPARYPEAAPSQLFRGTNGGWILDTENSARLAQIGLVTSAVWSDLNADGWPELIVACEWGPLKIFRNDHGQLSPWNPRVTGPTFNLQPSTLNSLTGWWTSVAAGDFDGDGRMDFVAGNFGENTSYRRYAPEPVRIFYGDFDDNGVFDALEAALDPGLKKIVPLRDPMAVAGALPQLGARFAGFTEYGQAGVAEVIGDMGRARELAARVFQSMLFLNRGTNFEARALPMEAQLAPAFGLGVADFDGDGHEDVLLAQNFFAVEPMTSRYDAGRGLLLLGRGDGTFRAASAAESGVAVYGEGRGVAVSDYDGDGRVDVCVGQNGAQTKLFHNDRARPGLRVRLQGSPANPHAIGAVLRPIFADGTMGAAREIHAGSGWLSQDSAVPVLSLPKPVTALSILWPGGQTTQTNVPPGAREVTVSSPPTK